MLFINILYVMSIVFEVEMASHFIGKPQLKIIIFKIR